MSPPPDAPRDDDSGVADDGGGAYRYPRPPGRLGRFAASGPAAARRWIRWGWLAALAWWVWTTGLLLVWLIGPAIQEGMAAAGDGGADDAAFLPARIVIYYGVEGFLVGMLGLGLNQRWRLAAALLPVVFAIARVIALTRLEPLALDGKGAFWVVVYLLLLFLFVRGAQGAFSYHWFTHPRHPGG